MASRYVKIKTVEELKELGPLGLVVWKDYRITEPATDAWWRSDVPFSARDYYIKRGRFYYIVEED